jgi:hypothetical protein
MRASLALATVLAAFAPGGALADRGALTLELSPALTWWPSMGPSVGSGDGVSGTTAGGLVGVRYALRNDLDLTAAGFYEAPADFTNPGTTVDTAAGPLTGTLTARTSRWGALVGARWVHGLVWRWFVGAEIGWSQQSFTELDLIDVSDPSNPQSFGLGLADRSQGAFVLSPLAGVEWQFADHWSVAIAPRVQVMLDGVGRVGVVLPVSVGYSWYGW